MIRARLPLAVPYTIPSTIARGLRLLAVAALVAAAGCSTPPPASPPAASAATGTAAGSVAPLPAFQVWSEGFAARWEQGGVWIGVGLMCVSFAVYALLIVLRRGRGSLAALGLDD